MFKSVFGGEEQRREETMKIIFEGSGWLLSIFEMLFSFQTQIKYLKLLPSMQFMMWKPNQPQILFSLSQLPTSFNLFKFDIYQCCPHLIALIIGFEKIFVYWSPLWLFWSQHCQSSLYLIWKQIKKEKFFAFLFFEDVVFKPPCYVLFALVCAFYCIFYVSCKKENSKQRTVD